MGQSETRIIQPIFVNSLTVQTPFHGVSTQDLHTGNFKIACAFTPEAVDAGEELVAKLITAAK